MSTFEVLVLVGLALLLGLAVAAVVLLLKNPTLQLEPKLDAMDRQLSDNLGIINLAVSGIREEMGSSASALREEVSKRVEALGTNLQTTLGTIGTQQSERFDGFAKQLVEHRNAAGEDAKLLRTEVNDSLRALGKNVEAHLDKIRTENAQKLEEMRVTVDEKLQGTLEKRLGASFSQVNENLKHVYESVGEMQKLASGVGDLKRVLSNVKLRGSWFEGSLERMLDDVLTRDQFSTNVEVKPGSGERVEFAIKMPTDGEQPVWLSIDSKMPKEDYERLSHASEQGDADAVEQCAKSLERCVLKHAKDISEKYICAPHTLDVAVMFMPTEGLFAEVVRRPGLIDRLQRELHIMVTGPTTLHALLSAIRVGFRSQAIQERSTEIWRVLGAVKTEFSKFGIVLDKVHKKLGEAQHVVEDAHKRKRAVDRKLREVESLPDAAASDLLKVGSLSDEPVVVSLDNPLAPKLEPADADEDAED
jgi:DNA recombination protein RmuC